MRLLNSSQVPFLTQIMPVLIVHRFLSGLIFALFPLPDILWNWNCSCCLCYIFTHCGLSTRHVVLLLFNFFFFFFLLFFFFFFLFNFVSKIALIQMLSAPPLSCIPGMWRAPDELSEKDCNFLPKPIKNMNICPSIVNILSRSPSKWLNTVARIFL